MKVLIATAKQPPTIEVARQFAEDLRLNAEVFGLRVVSGVQWVQGRGCANLAFEVEGADVEAEHFAHNMAMALLPSKWCTYVGASPEDDTLFGSPY